MLNAEKHKFGSKTITRLAWTNQDVAIAVVVGIDSASKAKKLMMKSEVMETQFILNTESMIRELEGLRVLIR